MNTSLFRSPLALIPLAAAAGLLALAVLQDGGGVVGAASRAARLATGAAALACALLALGYVLRKYMHKYGYSPEFRLEVGIAKMERAESRLNSLRRAILQGQHATRDEVLALARRILREEGVQRVLRAHVEPGTGGGPRFVLRVTKTFPLGKAARWLHLHLYISLAFALAVWAHGGGAAGFGSPLGALLLATAALVVVTGVVGIALWARGPAWLTARERDLSIEESFVLREGFGRKLKELREKLDPDARAALDHAGGADAARALLAAASGADPARKLLLQDALVLRGQLARVEAEFRALWRTRLAFMAWRAVHLPAAIAFSALVVVHLVSLWVY